MSNSEVMSKILDHVIDQGEEVDGEMVANCQVSLNTLVMMGNQTVNFLDGALKRGPTPGSYAMVVSVMTSDKRKGLIEYIFPADHVARVMRQVSLSNIVNAKVMPPSNLRQ